MDHGTAAGSTAGSVLTASQCRRLLGKVLATARFNDPDGFCEPTYSIPPDPYARARLDAWPPHQRRYSAVDVARLLRGKRISFIGDSLTGQVSNAFECSLRRAGQRLERADVMLTVPPLREACRELWDAVLLGKGGDNSSSSCGCRVSELVSWQDSSCRMLGRGGAAAARARDAASFQVQGMQALQYNLTWFQRFGDVYQYVRACPVCRPMPVSAGAGASRRLSRVSTGRQCDQVDFCAARRLPSHVEMVRLTDLADVIVLNFGLWYHDRAAYEEAATAALRDLDSFGQMPGKVRLCLAT